MQHFSRNVLTVLDILKDEVRGDTRSALRKMTKDYSMTWMYIGDKKKGIFPTTSNDLKTELEEVYPIKGRRYEIKNIAEGSNVVMVELIESYPHQKTGKIYRTPLVLVLEMKNGKIRTGRHYLDPRLSEKYLSTKEVACAYKNPQKSQFSDQWLIF